MVAQKEVGIDYNSFNQFRPAGKSKGSYFHMELIPYVLAECAYLGFSVPVINEMMKGFNQVSSSVPQVTKSDSH